MRKVLLLAIMVMTAVACGRRDGGSADVRDKMSDVPSIVLRVQDCSRLYVSEYVVHKIVVRDDNTLLNVNVNGRAVGIKKPGERKIAIPVDATVEAYIDFTDFSSDNVAKDGDKITITLPDPQAEITSLKADYNHERAYVSWLRSDFSESEKTHFLRQARSEIAGSMPALGIYDNARDNAAQVLIPLLVSLGYDERNVTITFRSDFNPRGVVLKEKTKR